MSVYKILGAGGTASSLLPGLILRGICILIKRHPQSVRSTECEINNKGIQNNIFFKENFGHYILSKLLFPKQETYIKVGLDNYDDINFEREIYIYFIQNTGASCIK